MCKMLLEQPTVKSSIGSTWCSKEVRGGEVSGKTELSSLQIPSPSPAEEGSAQALKKIRAASDPSCDFQQGHPPPTRYRKSTPHPPYSPRSGNPSSRKTLATSALFL